MNDYTFGNYIFELRSRAGLSQSDLAAEIGVTNKAVSKWEVGKAKPSVETIRKLAGFFQVSIEDLLKKREDIKQKGESFMKNLPPVMPEYSIVKSDKEPFEAVCNELPGWLIIPRIGEHIVFGNYEAPSGKILDLCELKVEHEIEIHGIRGVKISCLLKSFDRSELCETQSTAEYNMDLFAQLTDDRCRFLAQGQTDDGVYRLRMFLDGDDFCDDWGCGEDNRGRETHLKKKSEIVRDGSIITCAEKQYSIEDVVGRYTVTVGKNKYDTICLFCVYPSDSKIVTEQYIDKDGKTVLWRRFNRNDWGFGRYGKLWTELRPENECLTVNGNIYVHWYDTLSTFTLR